MCLNKIPQPSRETVGKVVRVAELHLDLILLCCVVSYVCSVYVHTYTMQQLSACPVHVSCVNLIRDDNPAEKRTRPDKMHARRILMKGAAERNNLIWLDQKDHALDIPLVVVYEIKPRMRTTQLAKNSHVLVLVLDSRIKCTILNVHMLALGFMNGIFVMRPEKIIAFAARIGMAYIPTYALVTEVQKAYLRIRGLEHSDIF